MARRFVSIIALWLLALPLTAAERSPYPADPTEFLFVVDVSSNMKRAAPAARAVVGTLLANGAQGRMRRGDVFTVWLVQDTVVTNAFRSERWLPEIAMAQAGTVTKALEQVKLTGKPAQDDAVAAVMERAGQRRVMYVFLISDGSEVLYGTPFDLPVSTIYMTHRKDMAARRAPFVTTLLAHKGTFTAWSVDAAGAALRIPELPPEPPQKESAPPEPAKPAGATKPSTTPPAPPASKPAPEQTQPPRTAGATTPTPPTPRPVATPPAPTPKPEVAVPAPTPGRTGTPQPAAPASPSPAPQPGPVTSKTPPPVNVTVAATPAPAPKPATSPAPKQTPVAAAPKAVAPPAAPPATPKADGGPAGLINPKPPVTVVNAQTNAPVTAPPVPKPGITPSPPVAASNIAKQPPALPARPATDKVALSKPITAPPIGDGLEFTSQGTVVDVPVTKPPAPEPEAGAKTEDGAEKPALPSAGRTPAPVAPASEAETGSPGHDSPAPSAAMPPPPVAPRPVAVVAPAPATSAWAYLTFGVALLGGAVIMGYLLLRRQNAGSGASLISESFDREQRSQRTKPKDH